MNQSIHQLFNFLESNVTKTSVKRCCSVTVNVAKLIELNPHPMTSSLTDLRFFEASNLLNNAFYTISICELTNKLFKSVHKIIKFSIPEKPRISRLRRSGRLVSLNSNPLNSNQQWMDTAVTVLNIAHDSLELIVWFSKHPSINLFTMGNVVPLTISVTVCSIKITKDLLNAYKKGELDTINCVNVISNAVAVTFASHSVLGVIISKTGFKLSCCTKKSIQCVCNIAVQILCTDHTSGCSGTCC